MVVVLRLALTAVLVMALATPAEAAPSFRTERTYFHCNGSTKVGNVNFAAEQAVPSWNTTPPAQSVQQGAGCGFGDVLVSTTAQKNPADAIFEGDFVGNLNAFTVQLHDINAGPSRQSGTISFQVAVTVDGKSMFGGADATPTPKPVTVTLTPSNSGVTGIAEFTVTGLGFSGEDGDGTTKRRIVLKVSQTGFDASAWVFDTTEVPSGITFNPAAAAAVTIPRT